MKGQSVESVAEPLDRHDPVLGVEIVLFRRIAGLLQHHCEATSNGLNKIPQTLDWRIENSVSNVLDALRHEKAKQLVVVSAQLADPTARPNTEFLLREGDPL
ncbi:hypothetical protein WJS89_12050 [Sphingomicrobium sp. XHP0235]|uniref:hypothetical protein n=1 Tax=Sphingomicrobium aquimarinum TaxID=3133971 RepID=UPI0031FE529B